MRGVLDRVRLFPSARNVTDLWHLHHLLYGGNKIHWVISLSRVLRVFLLLFLLSFFCLFVGNFVFTRESLSLFRVLSPSFIFSCTTIASSFAHLYCIVIYCCWRENDNTLNNERLSLVMTKLPIKNYGIEALVLLPYNMSIILKLKSHIKGRLISRI